MRSFPRFTRTRLLFIPGLLLVLALNLSPSSFASAYNAHPKLVVIIVIDQFRGDYLERYREQFGDGGFRLFLDHGAYFSDCNYNYANTHTAPGHPTLVPTHAVGRVLTEALARPHYEENSGGLRK